MTAITLQEPFRAVFYTPFYAALARDDFAAEGVEVRLLTVDDPDRAAANLLSGAADLAWSGPMRVIRDHARDPFFEDIAAPVLEHAIGRNLALGIWSRTPRFPRDPFGVLEAATLGAGAIPRTPGFASCVDEAIVEEALA